MVDYIGQTLKVGDDVIIAINGPKLGRGRVQKILVERSEFRIVEGCVVEMSGGRTFVKNRNQVFKINKEEE
jgi:hypothetical protein